MRVVTVFLFWIFTLAFQTLNAQSDYSDLPFDSATLHIAKDNINCLYGLKNVRNEWVIKPIYDNLHENSSNYHYFEIEHHYKKGLIRKDGKFFLNPIYDEINSVKLVGRYYLYNGFFGFNDYFIVSQKQQQGLYCAQTQSFTLPFCKYQFRANNRFLIVKDSLGLLGLADSNHIILSPRFNFLNELSGFYNPALFIFSNHKDIDILSLHDSSIFGLVNLKGEIIAAPQYVKFLPSWFANQAVWGIRRQNGVNVGIDLIGQNAQVLFSRNDPDPQLTFEYYLQIKNQKTLALIPCKDSDVIVNQWGAVIDKEPKNHFELFDNQNVTYYIDQSNGVCRLKNDRGQPVFKETYTKLIHFETELKSKIQPCFIAQKNKKYGIIDAKNKTIFPFVYEQAFLSNDDRLILIKDSLVSIFYTNNLKESTKNYYFNGDFAVLTQSREGQIDLEGLMDRQFHLVLSPFYTIKKINDRNWMFSNGQEKGIVSCFNGEIQFKKIPQFKEIGAFQNESAYTYAITESNHAVIIGEDYQVLGDTLAAAVSDFDPQHEVYWWKPSLTMPENSDEEEEVSFDNYELGNWGLKNKFGQSIFDTIIDYPNVFLNGRCIVSVSGKFGLINQNGQVLMPFVYDSLFYADNNRLFYYQKGKFGLADWNGRYLSQLLYDDVSCFLGRHALMQKKGKLGALRTDSLYYSDIKGYIQRHHLPLDSFFTFYDTYLGNMHVSGELEHSQSYTYYEILETIQAKDSLWSIDLKRNIQNEIGFMILPNYLYSQSDYLPYNTWPDLHYSDIYWRNEDRRFWGRESTVKYRELSLTSINSSFMSLMINESQTDAAAWSEGYTVSKYKFINYQFLGDTLKELDLSDVFIPNYRNKLNSLFMKQLSLLDDLEIDCKNPSKLLENITHAFAFSAEGLVFYINPNGDYDDEYYEMSAPIEIIIPYEELKTIIQKSYIGKFKF